MSEFSQLLFARPSFIEGVGRLVDFAGTLSEYNGSESGAIADELAIRSDWQAVGDDLTASIEKQTTELDRV